MHAAHHPHAGDPLCQPGRAGRRERGAVRLRCSRAGRSAPAVAQIDPHDPQRPRQPAAGVRTCRRRAWREPLPSPGRQRRRGRVCQRRAGIAPQRVRRRADARPHARQPFRGPPQRRSAPAATVAASRRRSRSPPSPQVRPRRRRRARRRSTRCRRSRARRRRCLAVARHRGARAAAPQRSPRARGAPRADPGTRRCIAWTPTPQLHHRRRRARRCASHRAAAGAARTAPRAAMPAHQRRAPRMPAPAPRAATPQPQPQMQPAAGAA